MHTASAVSERENNNGARVMIFVSLGDEEDGEHDSVGFMDTYKNSCNVGRPFFFRTELFNKNHQYPILSRCAIG